MEFDKLGKVTGVGHDHDEIFIACENGSFRLKAYGDCCSKSHFELPETPDVNSIVVGHVIKSIDNDGVNRDDDYPAIKKMDMMIELDEGSYSFLLINSSNGYYSGWFEIEKFKIN